MKKIVTILSLVVIVPALFIAFKPGEKALPETPQYIVIGWNDLGMHCANKDFSSMCVLPPYNNQTAHVILRGSQSQLPQVMGLGSGFYVTYEIPGNTYSVGKTNFWTYAYQLFGVNLPNNIGLTGVGLTGTMWDSSNYFHVSGIPVTPYQDADLTHESPFQLTLLKAYDAGNNLVAQTQDVIPVSNEINCVSSGCHTSEQQILTNHEENLPAPPVLCASCHADPVLGTTGNPEAGYFSMRMHQQHGSITNDCYKCHPGPNTQCFRDIMFTHGLTCQTCHGSVANVGNTIAAGRTPWLQEPSCGAVTCHGPNFAEEPNTLYRNSQGHGNLFCSTCHGSPHAILPTIQPNDNLQNITLQGYSGTLSKCEVCHGYIPAGPGPHGFNPLGIKPVSDLIPDRDEILPNYPNPFNFMTNIPYHVKKAGFVTLEVYNMEGLKVKTLMQDNLAAGEYKAELYSSGIPSGTYICKLQNGTSVDTRKIVLSK